MSKSYIDDFAPEIAEILNNLIETLRKKNKYENLNCKWLILLDEVAIWRHGVNDFSTLNLDDDDNIELVAALSGGIFGMFSYSIISPRYGNFITKRFTLVPLSRFFT